MNILPMWAASWVWGSSSVFPSCPPKICLSKHLLTLSLKLKSPQILTWACQRLRRAPLGLPSLLSVFGLPPALRMFGIPSPTPAPPPPGIHQLRPFRNELTPGTTRTGRRQLIPKHPSLISAMGEGPHGAGSRRVLPAPQVRSGRTNPWKETQLEGGKGAKQDPSKWAWQLFLWAKLYASRNSSL